MQTFFLCFLCMLVLVFPVSAQSPDGIPPFERPSTVDLKGDVTQTCIIVTAYNAGGAKMQDVYIARRGGATKSTGSSGTTLWCVGLDQRATQVWFTRGSVIKVTNKNGSAWIQGTEAYLAWPENTEYVYVDLVGEIGAPEPTVTSTVAPTPTVTETYGPSPTPRRTHIPNEDEPYAIIMASPVEHKPDRFLWTYRSGGGGTVLPISMDGDSWPRSGAEPNTFEANGYVVWYLTETGANPPSTPVITVIATRESTQTRYPTYTPYPTYTRRPINTPRPEYTTQPTYTPYPTREPSATVSVTPDLASRIEQIERDAADMDIILHITAEWNYKGLGK